MHKVVSILIPCPLRGSLKVTGSVAGTLDLPPSAFLTFALGLFSFQQIVVIGTLAKQLGPTFRTTFILAGYAFGVWQPFLAFRADAVSTNAHFMPAFYNHCSTP